MRDNVFIDSNVIIYAYSEDEPKKQAIVKDLLNQHENLYISTQTINEFVNVTTKKKMLDHDQVSAVVEELFEMFSVIHLDQSIIQNAIVFAKKHRYSYFDSLMIGSALAANCTVLYSEDMHHGHIIESNLKLINPFQK